MARAEVGSTKYISNKLKSKGLQRLRWYCQVCERQMRDENGFKCHTQSESHVRQMLLVGEDPKKYINQYSSEFLSDFIKLLRTAHGEKAVQINHFYQEYIANKEHVHMNATRWSSLTEFAKYLGKEGICRVEEGEKGLFISWVDNSPEALRRQDAIRKRERQDRGDEEREQKMIEAQIKRAQQDKEAAAAAAAAAGGRKNQEGADQGKEHGEDDESRRMLKRAEGEEKIKLSFTPKVATTTSAGGGAAAAATSELSTHTAITAKTSTSPPPPPPPSATGSKPEPSSTSAAAAPTAPAPAPASAPAPFKMNITTAKPKNVFAAAAKKKKQPGATSSTSGAATTTTTTASRPLSATEKVIKEDMERKRRREGGGGGGGIGFSFNKKPKVA